MNLSDISLSSDNSEFVQEQLARGRFSSPADVVNEALKQARIREAKATLAALLQEGLNSGPPIEVTEALRQEKRAEFLSQLPPGSAE